MGLLLGPPVLLAAGFIGTCWHLLRPRVIRTEVASVALRNGLTWWPVAPIAIFGLAYVVMATILVSTGEVVPAESDEDAPEPAPALGDGSDTLLWLDLSEILVLVFTTVVLLGVLLRTRRVCRWGASEESGLDLRAVAPFAPMLLPGLVLLGRRGWEAACSRPPEIPWTYCLAPTSGQLLAGLAVDLAPFLLGAVVLAAVWLTTRAYLLESRLARWTALHFVGLLVALLALLPLVARAFVALVFVGEPLPGPEDVNQVVDPTSPAQVALVLGAVLLLFVQVAWHAGALLVPPQWRSQAYADPLVRPAVRPLS